MNEEVVKKLREADAVARKAMQELRDAHLRHVLLDASDGPEGIKIYVSEEEGVVDWSETFPAVYVEISLQGASFRCGPFQMREIHDKLMRQIRPLPQAGRVLSFETCKSCGQYHPGEECLPE